MSIKVLWFLSFLYVSAYLENTVTTKAHLTTTMRVENSTELSEDEDQEREVRTVPMDDICLQCICEGTSGCTRKADNCFENLCGRFRMTRMFWRDAGMLTIERDTPRKKGAFVNCALDSNCSRRTVTAYVSKYARDCNRDSVVSCLDYAVIHQLGPVGCVQGKTIDPFFFSDFVDCLQSRFYSKAPDQIGKNWKKTLCLFIFLLLVLSHA